MEGKWRVNGGQLRKQKPKQRNFKPKMITQANTSQHKPIQSYTSQQKPTQSNIRLHKAIYILIIGLFRGWRVLSKLGFYASFHRHFISISRSYVITYQKDHTNTREVHALLSTPHFTVFVLVKSLSRLRSGSEQPLENRSRDNKSSQI
jgi:hypothetical protein